MTMSGFVKLPTVDGNKGERKTIVEDADSDAEAERNLIIHHIQRLSYVYILRIARSFIVFFSLKKEGKR